MRSRTVVSAVFVAAALAGVPELSAQERDPARADALFKEAVELIKIDDWASACPKFDQSMSLDPSVGAAINIARCREREGKTLTAWKSFEAARALNRGPDGQPINAASEDFINQALARVEPRIPTLTLTLTKEGAPPGLTVTLDGSSVNTFGTQIRLDPGRHRVVAEAPGYQKLERDIELTEAKSEQVLLALVVVSQSVARPPPPPPPPPAAPGLGAQQVAGLVLGGAGAVALVTAAVSGGLALGASNELGELDCQGDDETLRCPTDLLADAEALKDRMDGLALTSTVTMFVGVALAGTGLVVFLTAPSSEREVTVAPMVGAGFVGVQIGGEL